MASPPIQPYRNVNAASFDFWGKPVLAAADGTYWCPGFDGATYALNPLDYVMIRGVQTPGIAEVSVNRERDIDVKKPAGSDGARLTFHGLNPARVEIRLTIWTPEQLRQLDLMWGTLFPPAGLVTAVATALSIAPLGGALASAFNTLSNAFDVHHPSFTTNSIGALVFTGSSGPDPGSVIHTRTFTIRALEWINPSSKVATKTINKSAGTAPLTTGLDPASYPTPGRVPGNTGP